MYLSKCWKERSLPFLDRMQQENRRPFAPSAGWRRSVQERSTLDEKPIHRAPSYRIVENGIIHVPEGRGLFSTLTVQENLELGAYTPKARKSIHETLEHVFSLFPRLQERQRQMAGSLSGGEQQMCAIARGLMAKPRILMIDEMSLGLAPVLVQAMFEIVREIAESGYTVLLVEQQIHRALQLAHSAFILENGRTVLSGSRRT